LPRRHSRSRRNGFFFPAIRELAGKKSHPAKVRPQKNLFIKYISPLPDGLRTPDQGNLDKLLTARLPTLMM
jgi:hypothetical protein